LQILSITLQAMHSMVYDPQCMTIRSRLGTVPTISIHVHSDLFFIMSYGAHCAHLHIFAHINSDLDSVFHNFSFLLFLSSSSLVAHVICMSAHRKSGSSAHDRFLCAGTPFFMTLCQANFAKSLSIRQNVRIQNDEDNYCDW
jgi:hypothetical protein